MRLHIGKILKEISKKKGINQAELARKINTTRQNVQSIFKRETIDTGILIKLCEVLDHDFFQYYSHSLNLKEHKNESKVNEIEAIYNLLSISLEKFGRLKKTISQK